jgi:hypothetical protein
MNGAILHSIGCQVLTIFLLALAAMVYVMVVIANTSSSTVIKPVASPGFRSGSATHRITEQGGRPEAPSPTISDQDRSLWPSPSEPSPDMASFQGKNGDYRYDDIILKAASDYGIDPAVIKAVIMAESGFNPQAISYAGAQGLMQLMPRTARALDIKDPMDPRANIQGGTRYLKRLLRRFQGDLELALAAYNAGSRNVRRHHGIPPFKATKRYIAKIKVYHHYYRQQGFSLASRVVAAIPPELNRFRPVALARYLTFFSSLCRAAV